MRVKDARREGTGQTLRAIRDVLSGVGSRAMGKTPTRVEIVGGIKK
jgi:predicted RNA-binding protein YlqC (UPF0109 family)